MPGLTPRRVVEGAGLGSAEAAAGLDQGGQVVSGQLDDQRPLDI